MRTIMNIPKAPVIIRPRAKKSPVMYFWPVASLTGVANRPKVPTRAIPVAEIKIDIKPSGLFISVPLEEACVPLI